MIFTHSVYSFCVSGTIIGAKDRTVNKVTKVLLATRAVRDGVLDGYKRRNSK